MQDFRKGLGAPGMLGAVRDEFKKISDPKIRRGNLKSLADCLMSGVAIFGLKYPSLLQFETGGRHRDRDNLKALYGVEQVPSDTYFRQELDRVDPESIRPAFNAVFRLLQRGKGLKRYEWLNGHYLLPIDGTGYFYSDKVHCDSCCQKKHNDGRVSYYHNMLGAAIVHPDHREVIPLCPEPIVKTDGQAKNDCEQNAAKRIIERLAKEHPKLPMVIVEDALYANGPHIQMLKKHDMRYIIGVKPKDHKLLFEWVQKEGLTTYECTDEDGTHHRFSYTNGVPLNETHLETNVNFLEYWETPAKKSKRPVHFTWITDLSLSNKTVYQIMRGGRARWRIENETFNTLKNQGYHFEHNFGHGTQNLSTVMAFLMILAFLVDQIQLFSCDLFKAALRQCNNTKSWFWERLRAVFIYFQVQSWQEIYAFIANDRKVPVPNSS